MTKPVQKFVVALCPITVQVQVADLSTPQGRIEVRDAATYAWHEANERDELPTAAAVQAIQDLGCKAYSEDGNTVRISDLDGNLFELNWEPMVDGFDYPMSGEDGLDIDEQDAQCEREPEPDETEMLRRQIVDSHHNAIARIHAVYLKSIAAADDVLRCSLALLDQEPTAMCDGCEKRHPECDVETHTMGDESMALCEQCKQRDHAHRTDS